MERIFCQGNEAIGWGAVSAGCLHFFGYPITPQNEVTEWFARELPKRGGCFVQSEAENATAAMVHGAAATGVRVMSSTASPGWGLMQEQLSNIIAAEVPCVIVNVQRGGPGQGSTQHAQMDYLQTTRGPHGGCRSMVLAPASVQEIHDLMQLAFYLADKYRLLTVLLMDAIVGQTYEPLEIKTIEFGPLPEKDWALKGTDRKGGRCDLIFTGQGVVGNYLGYLEHVDNKQKQITASEVRYECYRMDDNPALAIVAYGYTSRVSLDVVDRARAEGFKVGLIRPISLWPFPYDVVKEAASQGCKLLVVEDSLGQLVEDVKLAAEGKTEVHLLGMLARHLTSGSGMILPDRVYEEVKKLL